MSSWFAFYEPGTGRIESVLQGTPEIAKIQGGAFLPCGKEVSDETHYVATHGANKTIKEKQQLDTRHDIRDLTITFSRLPVGTVIAIGGESLTVDMDGGIIEFDEAGPRTFEIFPPPAYQDVILEVMIG